MIKHNSMLAIAHQEFMSAAMRQYMVFEKCSKKFKKTVDLGSQF